MTILDEIEAAMATYYRGYINMPLNKNLPRIRAALKAAQEMDEALDRAGHNATKSYCPACEAQRKFREVWNTKTEKENNT